MNSQEAAIGDTIFSKMLFSACSIDSLYWDANGWMTYQFTVLDTTVNGDTPLGGDIFKCFALLFARHLEVTHATATFASSTDIALKI